MGLCAMAVFVGKEACSYIWIYWVGSLLGATIAVAAYFFLQPPEHMERGLRETKERWDRLSLQ
jgi:hypothetical protein